ncbi:tRNA isopentenyl-2-thiomethyl-A-37 hydroxylase MiaE [Vibrio viridaestus]|uniref:tRNA-(Ms[2]io[6]A)-hydroxylase n=1 Tax=Vibrio viridaestus TaxID=2487322 RepID=A0A3N9TG42_9VIBR|nr:tRNA isopentenyl-2-thiomethyl-A-37 hydroxylase MiaE [Vibrio viridaestus]RQW63231.1 tRNA-(ms[2]io[6]A)-hydroxylase [Vibrio viridaestus]
MYQELLEPIHQFLAVKTPQSWLDKASQRANLPVILRDHMLCELKAAQSALFLIRKYAVDDESKQILQDWISPFENYAYRYLGDMESLKGKAQISKKLQPKSDSSYSQDLIDKMVLLIKEELHHFYQVLEIMQKNAISYENVPASRYAKGLIRHVKTYEPDALVDKLIIGAFIEARSCERFASLAPYMDESIKRFYISLLRSEARHYQDYLALAQSISTNDISERVEYFRNIEAELITNEDDDFKFHSGTPV